ncbi:MAG: hypothetical protein DRP87_05880 [Spirochaetes bacterium]|nr:MAG: hypothetical protein DRP87_05880 [Spirochaetota bacterium]
MEQIEGKIVINYTDNEINRIIQSISNSGQNVSFTRHFNQNEEFFIKLKSELKVPHLPIHHDVRMKQPSESYLKTLRKFLSELIPLLPEVFEGLTYFFDPGEILRPCFFSIQKTNRGNILYLLRLNLFFKTHEGEIIEKGTNDTTPEYRTNHLFLEGDLIPLEKIIFKNGDIEAFQIKQTISDTWIGETGRGYFVQGIWMDNDLTKFFSKLFIPRGKRIYPYYPFICKFRTIVHNLVDLSPVGRSRHLAYLENVLDFLAPEIEAIQDSLRNSEFSEDLPSFKELKDKIPPEWEKIWESFTVKPYLNDRDMKEFIVEY